MADSHAIDCGQHGMWVIGGELTDEQATAAALEVLRFYDGRIQACLVRNAKTGMVIPVLYKEREL